MCMQFNICKNKDDSKFGIDLVCFDMKILKKWLQLDRD